MWRVFTFLIVGCSWLAANLAVAEELPLVHDRPFTPAVERAVQELERALQSHGDTSTRRTSLPEGKGREIVIGVAGDSPLLDQLLKTHEIELGTAPESLAIRRFAEPVRLVIAGRDERGLLYALREVARTWATSTKQETPWLQVFDGNESPFLARRSITVHLFNADVERGWYFNEEFWHDYLTQLSRQRFNQLSLVFGDQNNYLTPPYPSLVEMPEFPEVKVSGLTPEQRTTNLKMLARIAELSAEYGIDLQLGVWMQAPIPRYSAPVEVIGLPEGLELARFCAIGMKRVLEACPAIRGVQLRMNEEAGVPEHQQTAFYQPLFTAIRELGRPVRLELRYKGLQPSTTQAAIDTGLDTTVSTKFWSEHFGLPYHPTIVDSHWRDSRYSFGAMLKKPRAYRVMYRLWNVGSQRLTIWGDPEFAARFAESCKLGDGEGFEVFAPLTNKGYGNRPGDWPVIKHPDYRVGRWEQDRYWFFYLCFGRLGYNPQTNPEVWKREFRQRFGESAERWEDAYISASRILPRITTVHLPGASEWSWWPEMDTGGAIREYMYVQPSDRVQFAPIRTWQKTDGWRWEEWDSQPGFVEQVIAGKPVAGRSPFTVAARQISIGDQLRLFQIERLRKLKFSDPAQATEARMTLVDFSILAELSRYHGSKRMAAMQLAFAELAQQPVRLPFVQKHLREARYWWQRIVDVTEPVYHENLVFGITPDSPRSKLGHHHSGHWKDRLAELDADLAWIEEKIKQEYRADQVFTPFPTERSEMHFPEIVHTPITSHRAGEPLSISIELPADYNTATLVHRPLDQTREWQRVPFEHESGRRFVAHVPATAIDPNFDWQYYIEANRTESATIDLWPSYQYTGKQPYFVVKVEPADK